ncbi:hypothetical protein Tco_0990225 [Tanacetum coccineum]|uniref:Transposase (Putative), gypsy type n=1 Tax=Tanacetum coccineum TaxID=301880 RepID=A0ABQ5EVV3_9ASTR
MYYHHLFMEFNVGTARQACLNVEAIDDEIENLKAQLLLKEAEAIEAVRLRAQVSAVEATEKMHADEINALKQRNVALENEKDSLDGKSQNDSLVDQVHALETTCSSLRDQVSGYERLKEQIKEFQDAKMNTVNDKVAKQDADLLEMALHLEEKFYPHLLITISGQRWLLTRGLKLVFVKCPNSPEYPTTLGSAISRALEKGMQSRLSAGIDHGKVGRSLEDVNPAAEADFNSALHRLRGVDFPLLVELSSYKDASAMDIMDLLRLESAASTSGNVPTTIVTTTALSTAFASPSSVPPITTHDYEIVSVNGQEDAQGNVQGNVASFYTVEFDKEELNTTPERDPPS